MDPRSRLPRIRQAAWIGVFAVLLAHALLLGPWIIDDAGISFVYARNLAAGNGLVAQPGLTPVEGFSNFAWVLLLTPFFALGVFDPVVVPKLLALLALGSTFLVLRRLFQSSDPAGETGALVCCAFLALSSPFVIWGVSGLENPLFALAAALALWLAIESLTLATSTSTLYGSRRGGALSGLAAALLAMTRPDGVVLAAAFPLLALWLTLGRRRGQSRETGLPPRSLPRLLGSFLAAFGSVFGAFLLFRRMYFGGWLPNTYAAKGGPHARDVLALLTLAPEMREKMTDLIWAVAGPAGIAAVALLLAALATCRIRRRLRDAHRIWLVFLALSILCFLLLPLDWMPEARFATPFFVFFYGSLVVLGGAAFRGLGSAGGARWRRLGLPLLVAGGLAAVGISSYARTSFFAQSPTVSFQDVERGYGERFNRYAQRLGLSDDGSILLPDVGGTLYVSKLRVYDLAGLLDPALARFLGRDFPALQDYVLGTVRPTFIHSHGFWTEMSRFELDPRFHRDYVPLLEYPDRKVDGRVLHSGDYLRRDVAEAHPAVVEEIRHELGGPWSDWPRLRAGW